MTTVSSVASSQTQSASRTSAQTLAGNFDTFLQLLTTQLKQQDPLQPMDATQFTSQLVQFATVEQAIQTNSHLESLSEAAKANEASGALNLLGREVTAATDQVELKEEGDATLTYSLPRDAKSVSITIRDSQGRNVYQATGETTAGDHLLTWNGVGASGQRQAAGTYDVEIKAVDAGGEALNVEQLFTGVVTGVQPNEDGVQVGVGGLSFPMSAVREVRGAR